MESPKIWIALPAYNEEENLENLLERWEVVFSSLGTEREYIIVDDGSIDQTPKVLKKLSQQLPLYIKTHQSNQGLGVTIRDALFIVSEKAHPDDIIITMDSDNTQPPELFQEMLETVLNKQKDVVIASRYQPQSQIIGLSSWRQFLSLGARYLFQSVFPIPGVIDYTSGYRAYRAKTLQKGFKVYGHRFIDQKGFHAMSDILLRLSWLGFSFGEVGMELRYDLKVGYSKMNVWKTILRTIWIIIIRRIEGKPQHLMEL
jgi:dolichol-phosphate mannosyltransferase